MTTRLLTTSIRDSTLLASELNQREFLVVSLCAAWCDVCKQFREEFAALAANHADVAFVWLDVEDDAALAGDIDVEDFPTLAIFHRDRLLYFGVSLPQQGVVTRLLLSLKEGGKTREAEKAVTALPSLLAHHARRLNAKIG